MELVLYIVIAWMVVTYLITTIQREDVIRSIIIYFIFSMLYESFFSIVDLNFRVITITENRIKFLMFLINRDIIMPFLILIFINYFYRMHIHKRVISIILLIISISLLEFANLKFGIYSYHQWNFLLSFIISFVFILITLIISKFIDITQLRSEQR